MAFPSLITHLIHQTWLNRTFDSFPNSHLPRSKKLLYHWGFSKECATCPDTLLEEFLGVLSMAVVIGINLRVPGCLLEGGKIHTGCERFGLVTIPFPKLCNQQNGHTSTHPTPPHQASLDLAPLVAGELLNICLNFKQGRTGSSDLRPSFKDTVKCLV